MTDSVGNKTAGDDGEEGGATTTTTGSGSRAGSIPSTSAHRNRRSSSEEELEPVAGTSSNIHNHNQYQAIPTTSNSAAAAAAANAPAQRQQSVPAQGTSSSSVERQNSTSSTRSEGGGGEQQQQQQQQQRRFPFLDFDSSSSGPPRHIQALAMIQEWARNSMGASIPMLGSSNSSTNTSNANGAGGGDNFTSLNERGGGGRPLQVRGQNGDSQISMPVGGDLPLLQQSSPAGLGPVSSNPALSLPSRLARGLLQSSNFRRRSDDVPEPPVIYNQATSSASMMGGGNSTLRGDRDALTLDIESNGGLGSGGANNGNGGGSTNWEESRAGGGGSNSVPDGDESRRPSADGHSRRVSGSATTPGGGDGGTGTGTGGGSTEGTPTAPGDILRDSPETRAFIEEINQYTTLRPFLILMLLKSLVDHGSGIVCFIALIVTFSHANSLLKKEISKQRKRNLLFLVMIVVNLIGCAGFIYYVFSDEELYYALGFMSTKVELTSFWMLMWVVGVTDYIAKFGAIVAKSFIVAMPTALIPFQKRGIYYLFIEQTSQLYRSALPAHHWVLYLTQSYDGSMKMFGLILGGLYTLFKLVDSVQRVKDWNSAFRKLFQNVHYGTSVTAKELDSMDSVICPICHDSFTSPTRLSCSHVFCEECVSTWFDRGMTCPMCRAKVVDDPTFRDGTTAQYIQFF